MGQSVRVLACQPESIMHTPDTTHAHPHNGHHARTHTHAHCVTHQAARARPHLPSRVHHAHTGHLGCVPQQHNGGCASGAAIPAVTVPNTDITIGQTRHHGAGSGGQVEGGDLQGQRLQGLGSGVQVEGGDLQGQRLQVLGSGGQVEGGHHQVWSLMGARSSRCRGRREGRGQEQQVQGQA